MAAITVGTTVWMTEEDGRPSAKWPGEWTVEKINPTTYRLAQPGRTLRASKSLVSQVRPAGGPRLAAARFPWQQGTLVRWDDAPAKATGDSGHKLFVVISDDGGPRVTRIVLLGNANGMYWRRVPASALTEVKVEDVLREDA